MENKISLPKNKFDFESIISLKKIKSKDLKSAIPELLTWTQDSNWPISSEVRNILRQFDEELIEPMRDVLKSNDTSWKYFLLIDFIPTLSPSLIKQWEEELIFLSINPTEAEKEDEIDRLAIEALNIINNI